MPIIPPDNVTAGSAGHITHHNEISDVLTDHENRVATNESNVATLQTQMTAQTVQPTLYAQTTAPTPGAAYSQVWVDVT